MIKGNPLAALFLQKVSSHVGVRHVSLCAALLSLPCDCAGCAASKIVPSLWSETQHISRG